MDAGLRAWAQQQFAMGRVSIAELQRARCCERPSGPQSDHPLTPVIEPGSASVRTRHDKLEKANEA